MSRRTTRTSRQSYDKVIRMDSCLPRWFIRATRIIFLMVCCLGVIHGYRYCQYISGRHQTLQMQLSHTKTQVHTLQHQFKQALNQQITTGGRTRGWLPVQKQVEDGVVQIFTQMAQFNWLRPYRAPEEVVSVGSGFFINPQGDILTNYHLVSMARAVMIRLPRLGQAQFKAEIVGVCPDRDIALLRLPEKVRQSLEAKLGSIPYLELGDSDQVGRTQEVMALGFPLGRLSLKSTIGNISGWERVGSQSLIQLTSPLNPGNSGGPAVDTSGKVVGINSSGIQGAQNTGFFIPITEIRHVLPDLYKTKLLRKPVLGGDFSIYLDNMREFLGNPAGGGWYFSHIYPNTLLDKAGLKAGDVLYEIDGHKLDCYGDVEVSWATDSKVSVLDLMNRYVMGDTLKAVAYRKGERKEFSLTMDGGFTLPIRQMFPDFEAIDYEIIGGMVVMQLNINLIKVLLERDSSLASYLTRYLRPDQQYEHALVVTHIFPDSPAKESKLIDVGLILATLNGVSVHTLAEFRAAILAHQHEKFMTLTTQYERRFAVLSYDDIKKKEATLAATHGYRVTKLGEVLLNKTAVLIK